MPMNSYAFLRAGGGRSLQGAGPATRAARRCPRSMSMCRRGVEIRDREGKRDRRLYSSDLRIFIGYVRVIFPRTITHEAWTSKDRRKRPGAEANYGPWMYPGSRQRRHSPTATRNSRSRDEHYRCQQQAPGPRLQDMSVLSECDCLRAERRQQGGSEGAASLER
jgi:hypothetical protein